MFRKDYKIWAIVLASILVIGLAVFVTFWDFFKNYKSTLNPDVSISVLTPVITKVAYTDVNTMTWLGIEGINVTDEIAASLGLKKTSGVFVTVVVPNSPAALASDGGLKKGDIIVKFDRKPVENLDALKALIASTEAGDTVRIEAVRDGDKAAYYVQMELRPGNARILQVAATSSTTKTTNGSWLGTNGILFALLLVMLLVVHGCIFRPKKIRLKSQKRIRRFTNSELVMHTLALISFVVQAITGFSLNVLSNKSLSYLDMQQKLIVIHVGMGAVFAFAVLWIIVRWFKHSYYLDRYDMAWLRNFGGYFSSGDKKKELPAGKFNAGQKMFFWFVAFSGLALLGTGLVIIFNNPEIFSGKNIVTQADYNIHVILAYLLLYGVLAHFYLVVFANPGVVNSMVSGYMLEDIAEVHNQLWLKRKRREAWERKEFVSDEI